MSEKNTEKIKAILEEKEVPDRISPEAIKNMLDTQASPQQRKISVQRKWIKYLSVAAVAVLVVGIGAAVYNNNLFKDSIIIEEGAMGHDCEEEGAMEHDCEEELSVSNLKRPNSYDEIYEYLEIDEMKNMEIVEQAFDKGVILEDAVADDRTDGVVADDWSSSEGGIVGEENADWDEESAAGADSAVSEDKEFTETYNQEKDVLEADIVKTDGDTIFYCVNDKFRAVKVKNGIFTDYKTIDVNRGYVQEMYLYEDKIVLISMCYGDDDMTAITVYSKDSYEKIGGFTVDGYFNDVRLMSDGYMYLVANYSLWLYDGDIDEDEIESYVPSYCLDGKDVCMEPDDIYMSTAKFYDTASYINIASFNLNSDTPCDPVDLKSVVGDAGHIYCSADNLYVTYGYDRTEITRFAIDDGKVIPKAGTKVKGRVKDQFSMSEYDGYFRIATSFTDNGFLGMGDYKENNALYVLDMSLDVVGKVTDFGIDEDIKSVNFSGNTAYIVTFRQTDPLYSIDLSNPQKPVIMDELKITGYSDYMQKWQDGMLLGFGESGDESGQLTGIKLAMFDNSNPDFLDVLDSVEINENEGTYITSEALYERKALLISPENNVIGVPVSKEIYRDDMYTALTGYVFYSYENGKFNELGIINNNITDVYDFYDVYFDRAIIIEDYVYVLSESMFVSADLNSFGEVDRCEFE